MFLTKVSAAQTDLFVGVYEIEDTFYKYRLELKADSTFEYIWTWHLIGGTERGKWHSKNQKSLILDSFNKPIKNQGYEKYNCIFSQDSILTEVSFFDLYNNELSVFPYFISGRDTLLYNKVDSNTFKVYRNGARKDEQLVCLAYPDNIFSTKLSHKSAHCINYYVMSEPYQRRVFNNEIIHFDIKEKTIRFKGASMMLLKK